MEKGKEMSEKSRGVIVFAVLAALTALEYIIALSGVPAVVLFLLAILKAGTVLYYFMHISRLFSKSEGE
jgi:heme/copper-type cytochrome/quinol oxidase subunit 4